MFPPPSASSLLQNHILVATFFVHVFIFFLSFSTQIQLAGTIAGQGILAAADGMASKGQFARHLLTSGINNLFAGQVNAR